MPALARNSLYLTRARAAPARAPHLRPKSEVRLWLEGALLWADPSVTELPNCNGLAFACNGHFRLFEPLTRGGTSLAPIAPAWHPPPRRHNDRTGDTCRSSALAQFDVNAST